MEWDLKGLSSLVTASDRQVEDGFSPRFSGALRHLEIVSLSKVTSLARAGAGTSQQSASSPARNDKGSIKVEIPQGQVSAALDCDNPILSLPLTWASRTLRDQTSAAGGN